MMGLRCFKPHRAPLAVEADPPRGDTGIMSQARNRCCKYEVEPCAYNSTRRPTRLLPNEERLAIITALRHQYHCSRLHA